MQRKSYLDFCAAFHQTAFSVIILAVGDVTVLSLEPSIAADSCWAGPTEVAIFIKQKSSWRGTKSGRIGKNVDETPMGNP